VYRALSLPVASHPLLWMTSARLAESREMVCDSMAAEVVEGRENCAVAAAAGVVAGEVPASENTSCHRNFRRQHFREEEL
jgi:hypothetical protein